MQMTTFTWILSIILLVCTAAAYADTSEGDQFLDGIGETALAARYLFNGNTEDWTRNTLHAEIVGEKADFVDDDQFGKVISLPGKTNGAYIKLPGNALNGFESISITGWVYINDLTPWQRFFDLGRGTSSYFYCTPVGEQRDSGCRARITARGYAGEQGPAAFRIATGKWVHLAVVLDSKKKTLSLFVDGTMVDQSDNISHSLSDILDQNDPAQNHLFLGKSLYDEDQAFGGRLYDIRFYSIALSDKQIAVIRHNAVSDDKITLIDESNATVEHETQKTGPQLLVDNLIGVKNVEINTAVGCLPLLPFYLPGIYSDNASRPDIRVIWPAPKDNSSVAKPGIYTISGSVPGTDFTPKATVNVVAQPSLEISNQQPLSPFPLGSVMLEKDQAGRDTPFIKNRDKFILTLAKTNPDSFLYNFRDAFGQPQPEGVRPLGVWDSQTCRLRGHASGHYLTAIAQAYASTTYDDTLHQNFRQKMDYMINTLYKFSQMAGKPAQQGGPSNADPVSVPVGPGRDSYDSDLSKEGIRTDYWNWGTGFISGYPPDQFIMLENGATYGGRNNQIWAPYYTLHKILAGLMDCYEVGGNPKALEIAQGMGLWVYKRLKVVPTETRIKMWNRYIAGEYGGMNEAMARLYLITKDKRFLDCAQLFDNIDFFFGNADHQHGLACNVDTIRGKHANQHIPQITGALETFKGTAHSEYYHVAENFWNICTHCYSYSIGGVAGAKNPNNAECFTAQPDTLYTNGFSQGGQNETCATYNMLKLSRQLFMFDQDARYMDYYEQALYNHILASVDDDNPGNTYHVPLNPGSRKSFGNARMNGFTCCNGTAIESSTKLQDSIYFKAADDSALYVNLYVPSTLNWSEKNITIKQVTSIPLSDTTSLEITGSGSFPIYLRIPNWAASGFKLKINGKSQDISAKPGSYVKLEQPWKSGDTIDLQIPMSFHLCPVMDQPNIASIFYGPVLLAVQEPDSRTSWREITLNADDLAKSFAGDPTTLTFTTNGVTLKPFYETYGYHSVYVDITLE